MRKQDIVLRISELTGVKKRITKVIVQKTLETIMEALKNGERIELRNFGVFYVKKRKKRIGRNPKTGQVIPIPERYTIVFKPGLEMKKAIK